MQVKDKINLAVKLHLPLSGVLYSYFNCFGNTNPKDIHTTSYVYKRGGKTVTSKYICKFGYITPEKAVNSILPFDYHTLLLIQKDISQ